MNPPATHSPATPSPDLYCVMGNPVEHSRSPWIHARFAALAGHAIRYDKRLVPLDGFAAAVAAFRAEGGLGCNVTVPFKFDAAGLATRLTPRAQLAGACNTLCFDPDGHGMLGDNTDGVGLVNDLQRHAGRPLRGVRVLLLGAGGAAAGVLGPLIETAPAQLVVANRTAAKAQALVQRHAALAADQRVPLAATPLEAVPGPFDVVINATASSLQAEAVPVAAEVLQPGALAYDMMYGPAARPFLAWAQAQGAVGRDGLGMLVEQAACAFALWRGVEPDTASVLAELRARVDANL